MKKKTLPKLPPIPDKKFFKIGEASELIGVPDHMLRYWEQAIPQFGALRRGTHRRYRPQDIQMGRLIRELKFSRGLTTEGIKTVLAEYKKTGEIQSGPTEAIPAAQDPVPSAPLPIKQEALTQEDIVFLEELVKSLTEIKEFLRLR